MYSMITLAPSISIPVDEFCFCWLSVEVCLVIRTVLGSGCHVGICKGDPFPLQGIQSVEDTCLALWMRVWDNR